MRLRSRVVALSIAAALSAVGTAVRADEAAALTNEILTLDAGATTRGSSVVVGKIASDFEYFAGSRENSTALVTGLRSGSEITLTQPGQPSATFTPATKPMGYGNVSTSLALAKYQLAQIGITNPTPAQLATALNGGTITYNGRLYTVPGVLQMRADGMGWGEIAQSLGTKLGPVVSGIKTQNAYIATRPVVQSLPASTQGGVSTAARVAPGANRAANDGRGAANRDAGGKGIVTAAGATSSATTAPKGQGAGGVTTAGGGSAAPRGQGIVTAAGRGASPVANGAGQGRGNVVTATGATAGAASGGASNAGGPGNGKALGQTK